MKKIITAALLVSAIFSASSFAADTPFYAGLRLGHTNAGDNTGYGFMGGYQIDKMFSVEASYTSLGGHSRVGTNYDYSTIGLAAVAMFPIKSKIPFDVFGKVGMDMTTYHYDVSGCTNCNINETKFGPSIGAGAQYEFDKATIGFPLSVRVGMDIYSNYSINMIYANAIYKF